MLACHLAEKLEIHFEIEINAPPEKVWAKLATLEGLKEWFGSNLVFEHKVGGRFQLEGVLPGEGPYKFTGQVVSIVPEQKLTFTWTEVGEKGVWPAHTLVTFQLSPSAVGTRVTLSHTGFAALGEALGKSAFEGHVQGWTMSETLKELKQAVEAAA
ncbi:MAG: SRPBCC domain-containing protein [Anaerolineales bacterium]